MTRRLAIATGLLATVFGVAGCDTVEEARVHVVYEQVANFQTYELTPDSASSFGAGDALFILYKVDQISNEGMLAQEFVFDPDELLTVTPDATMNEGSGDDSILLADQNADGIVVAAGETLSENDGLGCFIKLAKTNDLAELATTSSLVDLIHTVTPQQPVTMTRDGNDTDTALIFGDAVPSQPNVGLQELCNSN